MHEEFFFYEDIKLKIFAHPPVATTTTIIKKNPWKCFPYILLFRFQPRGQEFQGGWGGGGIVRGYKGKGN